MKPTKFILFLSLFFIFTGEIYAQWISLSSNTNNSLNDLFFISQDTGFVVGNNGAILKTTNNGDTWSTLTTNVTNNLRAIYFSSKNIGYSNALKTIDMGNSWADYSDSSTNSLMANDIYFINDSTGFYTDVNDSKVWKSSNHGQSWTSTPLNSSMVWQDIEFTTDSIGYIVGWYPPSIGKTTDMGNSWNIINSSQTQSFYSVSFPSKDIGYVVGDGIIIKTIDEGNAWITLITGLPSNISLYSIYCPNNNTCYAVGDSGTILKTINGGADWVNQNSVTTEKLNSIFFTDEDTGFIVGENGLILKTINGGTGINETNKKKAQVKIIPNPSKEAIAIEIEDNSIVNEGIATFLIYDLSGKQMLHFPIKKNKTNIETGSLSPGTYLYQLKNKSETIDLGKVIIQK